MSLLVWSWELFLLLLLQSLLGWIEPNVIPFLRFLLCNCARWVPGRRWLLKGPHKMWQCVVHAIHKICGRERLLINSLTAMSKLNLLGFSDLFFFGRGGGKPWPETNSWFIYPLSDLPNRRDHILVLLFSSDVISFYVLPFLLRLFFSSNGLTFFLRSWKFSSIHLTYALKFESLKARL